MFFCVGKIYAEMGEEKQTLKLSAPQRYILASKQRINLFMCGKGAGKSFLAGLGSGYFLGKYQAFGFIGANTYNQLNTATMRVVRQVWEKNFGWKEGYHYVVGVKPPAGFDTSRHFFQSYDGICSIRNGNVVFIGSLENAKAHEGKEFAWAFLDETQDTEESAVKEVILGRLREKSLGFKDGQLVNMSGGGFNPLYILTSPSKSTWLAEWFDLDRDMGEIIQRVHSKTDFFRLKYADKCICIASSYHNEANLPEGWIQSLIDNNTAVRAEALVYGNPFTQTGGEFYSGFSVTRHVGNVEFKPELPVHITFDQNVMPYISAGLWQVEYVGDKWELRQIDEFALPNPNNTTERLCESIAAKWGSRMNTVFLYGDASGNKRDTRGNATDYDIAKRVLRRWLNANSDRTERRNPPVIPRRDFINNIFEGREDYRIIIGENCKESINDFIYLKQDSNGMKWKEKGRDEVTGQTFEKYGHFSDSFDYFCTTIAANAFERFCSSR